ncbi:class I adenylate-forming enzyme family protein [Nonomuraea sp. NPDC005501]|uniref:class I adenylate-forming enzyme family protein n=1 Tax=Nonomuraea sp. NPDC005501 TaxID=3156884 RepID=UPI0033BBBAFF
MSSPSPVLLHDILARRAAVHPAAPAFTVDGVGTLDYLSWHSGARRVAAGLAAGGVRPGERVVLAFEDRDWLSFACCFMGVLAAGGVAVPVRAPVPEAQLPAIAARVDAAALVTGDGPGGHQSKEVLGGRRLRAGELPASELLAGELAAGGLPAAGPAAPRPAAPGPPANAGEAVRTGEDPAAVILTSGTTGAAKAVLSVHASLTDDWPPDEDVAPPQVNALFTAVAIGTNAAQSVLKSCLLNGVHVVLGQPFAPERLAALIEQHRVTALSLVPTTARLAVAALRGQGCAPSRVRSVVSSSAPLDQPTVAGLAEVFPAAEIFNVYTVAEGGAGLQHRCLPDRPPALGELGPDARLVDRAGRDVAPGEVGELWLRHTGPALGYLDQEREPGRQREPGQGREPDREGEADGQVEPVGGGSGAGTRYLADGWIATGDLCRRDERGTVYFVERADDVIVSGGLNVASATVEAALRTHAAVAEVAVFGVPHAALGRAVAAAVVLSGPATPADLRDHCARRLPREHVPADIVVVAELPVTPNGKVRKRLLAEQYTATYLTEQHPGTPLPRGRAGAERGAAGGADPDQGAGADVTASAPPAAADELEEAVLAAYRDALGVDRIRRDSHFLRLGGHSLLAARLAADLERRTGRQVPPALILRFPRAGDLSDALRLADPLGQAGDAPAAEAGASRGSGAVRGVVGDVDP